MRPVAEDRRLPLLDHDPGEPPVFLPGNLLESARTNAMATRGDDFEKGGDAGLEESLAVCALALQAAVVHAAENTHRKGEEK